MKNNYRQPAQTAEVSIPSTYDFQIQAFADLVNVSEARDEGLRILKDEYFTDEEILAGVAKIRQMTARGDTVDIISIRPKIGDRLFKQIINVTLSSMMEAIGHYNALAEQSRKRAICVTCQELMKVVSESKDDAKETELFSRLDDLRMQPGPFWKTSIFDYSANIRQPSPLLTCGGTVFATRQNLTVVSGKPKVCKTTFQSVIVAAAITGTSILTIGASNPLRVLLCDTEQSGYYLSRQCDRILRIAGIEKKIKEGFSVLELRSYEPAERYNLIAGAVEDLRPDLLFIDGAADLVADTNDLLSSERLVSDLLTLASKYNLGIVTIIHSNPGAEVKVRGHLGSTAERKSETVIILERDGVNDSITVKPRQTRNQPFKPFSFTLNDMGDPELVLPDERPKTAEDWLLYLMQPGKEYRNADLVSMMNEKGFKKSNTQYALAESLRKGRIDKKNDWYSIVLRQDDLPDI